MKTIIHKLVISTLLLLVLPGCKKEFLDVNRNPNYPEDVDVKYILPGAQSAIGYTLGNQLQVVSGIWVQYWTQGPNANQYNDYDRYFYNNSDADRPWSQFYTIALKDLDLIYKKAEAENKPYYSAIALILKAYTMQIITDAWGDVPLGEALQGDNGNLTPKFETQENIYNALIPMIDSGIAKLFENSEILPASDDIIFQGGSAGLELWYKFANTLKLKVYLRQVNVRPAVAAAGLAGMSPDPSEYLGPGEDATLHYISEKFRQNPLYTTVVALSPAKNIFASKTSVDYLKSIGDPRLEDFYDPDASGNFTGLPQGRAHDVNTFVPPVDDTKFSMYNHEQIIAPTVPVRLISAAESMFLQAEAAARGLMAGDAAGMYNAAIEESWGQWSTASSLIADSTFIGYMAQPGVAFPGAGTDQIKAIITQKWISMNGNQNFEAWTEFRRTGYPDFFTTSFSSDFGPGIFPGRLLYPADELLTNPNSPKGLTVTDRVWWDVN